MYNKKYRLEKIEEFDIHNPMYEDMEGRVCYLAYFNVGEKGWFLCQSNDWLSGPLPHRVRTSVVKEVKYVDNQVIVITKHTRLTFTLI